VQSHIGAGLVIREIASDEADDDDPRADDVADADHAAWEVHFASARERAFGRVDFPIYAIAGRTPAIGSWGTDQEGRLTSVSVHDATAPESMGVESQRGGGQRPSWAGELREILAGLVEDDCDRGPLSEAATKLRIRAAQRAARRQVASAQLEERLFVIDGVAEPFAFVGSGGAWVARRSHYDVTSQSAEVTSIRHPSRSSA
jgi:hypothetical protein